MKEKAIDFIGDAESMVSPVVVEKLTQLLSGDPSIMDEIGFREWATDALMNLSTFDNFHWVIGDNVNLTNVFCIVPGQIFQVTNTPVQEALSTCIAGKCELEKILEKFIKDIFPKIRFGCHVKVFQNGEGLNGQGVTITISIGPTEF